MGPRGYHGKASGTPAAAGGFELLRPSKAAAGLLRVLRPAQNVPRIAVSKPNTNSLWGLRSYHGQASGTPAKAAAGGFEFLRPSKAAAELLRVLRPAQSVPRSSFQAQ